MSRVVFFNGPPGCGKDTAANFLVRRGYVLQKMVQPAADAVKAFFSMDDALYNDLRERRKNDDAVELFGASMRKSLITLSEDWAKSIYGEEVFGILAARRVNAMPEANHVFSDSGFRPEVLAVASRVKNPLLIRIHRDGCTFSGDSRSYVRDLPFLALDIENNGTIEQLELYLDYTLNYASSQC